MTALTLATLLALVQSPEAAGPVYFGVVYHTPDSSADAIPGWYLNGTFRDANTARGFPIHGRFHGTSSDGHYLDVVIDSENPEREFAQSQYRVHLVPRVVTDTGASILFWDGVVSAHILPSTHPPLDASASSILLPQARRLVRLALAEADADMVAAHDTVQFEHPFVSRLAQAPELETIEF